MSLYCAFLDISPVIVTCKTRLGIYVDEDVDLQESNKIELVLQISWGSIRGSELY